MKQKNLYFIMVMVLTLAVPGCRTVQHYNQDEVVAAVLEVSTVLRNNLSFSEEDCKSDLGKAIFTQCTDLDHPIPLQWISMVEKAGGWPACRERVASGGSSTIQGAAFIFPFGIPLYNHAMMIIGTVSPPNVSFYSLSHDGVIKKLNYDPEDGVLLYDLVPHGAAWDENNIVYIFGRLVHTQQDRILKVEVSQDWVEVDLVMGKKQEADTNGANLSPEPRP
jgi:hypothetical protein